MHMKMYMYFDITTIWLKLSLFLYTWNDYYTVWDEVAFPNQSANSAINGQLLWSFRLILISVVVNFSFQLIFVSPSLQIH